MEKANELGCRMDFITIHLYQSFCSEGAVDDLLATLEALHGKYGLPIWLTEFGAIDIIARDSHATKLSADCTDANAILYMLEACDRMEKYDYVERYSWFIDNFSESGEDKAFEAVYTLLYDEDDNLSGTGQVMLTCLSPPPWNWTQNPLQTASPERNTRSRHTYPEAPETTTYL